MNPKYKIMIVAGEVSGDAHGAKLIEAIRELAPNADFEFFGATSHNLRKVGAETIINADELAVVGLPEITRRLPMFWKAFKELKNEAIKRKTDAVILIDFPDFNLKLAKSLKKKGLKVIYYVSPQLWAWRKYRARSIRKYVDLLLTILPFEKNWYEMRGISHVEYVGHPLANEVSSTLTKNEFCEKYKLDVSKPIVALLAGSRHTEISRILPVMLESASIMSDKNKDIQFVIALASTRKAVEVEDAIAEIENKELKLPKTLITVKNETREALNAADVAAVTSGTATLETTIIGTPFAIVYKTSAFNYKLLSPLVSVEHFGLVNLIAEERIVKELIQDDFTKESLADELFRLLEKNENQNMRKKLSEVKEKLGGGGTSKRAARAVLDVL